MRSGIVEKLAGSSRAKDKREQLANTYLSHGKHDFDDIPGMIKKYNRVYKKFVY